MTARDSGSSPRPAPVPRSGRRWLLIGLAVVAVAAIAGGAYGFSYLFLRPAAPAAVGLGTSSPSAAASGPAASVAASAVAAESAEPGGSGLAGSSLDGTWVVDASVGSFADFSGSFVGYRVEEELANVGAATAVGRTTDVSGSLNLAGTSLTAAEFTADLTTLRSDDNRRDGQLQRQGIETGTFPTATFTLTAPVELGSVPTDGQVVSVTATGELTLHGVTRSVEIPLEARLSGGVITVTGSTTIVFADYGIAKPNSFIVLSIADQGILEVQLHLTKG